MTRIKIKKARIFPSGEQFFPITHTKAVVDDQGNTVEGLLGSKVSISQMAGYTPTSGFATVNGASITGGGNVIITAGSSSITTIDATPTSGSTNPVQSGGVYDALDGGFYYVNS